MIVISILILIITTIIVYGIFEVKNNNKIKDKLKGTKIYEKISQYIFLLLKKKILSDKFNWLTPTLIVLVMILLFLVSYVLLNLYIKVPSTSIILSIPVSLSPLIIIKILLNKEKARIVKLLPLYAVNIKNHMNDEKNILKAIQLTNVEEPLKKYIDVFKSNISKGIRVIEAFDSLKNDVEVREFSEFIDACETCYLNGGNFEMVLENYIDLIAKENTHKESIKEKAYADILTLIIMIGLNIMVIVTFIFPNQEYASIIRETGMGRAILNFNAISYMIIGYLVSKIYKEE